MKLELMIYLGVAIASLLGILYKKLNPLTKTPLRLIAEDEPIVGTLEDLEAAEKVVAEGSVLDHQRKIFENYTRVERLHTSAGFSEDHVNKIVQALQRAGFDAFSRWQASAPPGTHSLMHSGYYEIFVARDQAEEAQLFMARQS